MSDFFEKEMLRLTGEANGKLEAILEVLKTPMKAVSAPPPMKGISTRRPSSAEAVASIFQDEQMQYVAAAIATANVPEWDVIAPFEVPRSTKWPRLRKVWMQMHPDCAVCRTKVLCVPHHVKPVHLWPEHELDPDNLVTLCPPHHLLFGHYMNWRSYNINVREDAIAWAKEIGSRPMLPTAAKQAMAGQETELLRQSFEAKGDAFCDRYEQETPVAAESY